MMQKRPVQQGFITMIIVIVIVIAAVLYLAYLRVAQVQH